MFAEIERVSVTAASAKDAQEELEKKIAQIFATDFNLDCSKLSCAAAGGTCHSIVWYADKEKSLTNHKGDKWLTPNVDPKGGQFEVWWEGMVQVTCDCGEKPEKPVAKKAGQPAAPKDGGGDTPPKKADDAPPKKKSDAPQVK